MLCASWKIAIVAGLKTMKPDCSLPTYITAVYVQINLYLYLDSLSQTNAQLHFADMLKLATEFLEDLTAVIGLLKWKLKSKADFRDDCLCNH